MRTGNAIAATFAPCLDTLEPRLLLSGAAPLAAALAAYAPPAGLIVAPQAEQESGGTPSNNDPQSAEALNFSYLVPHVSAVDGAGPRQAAVMGVCEGVAGPGFDNTSTVFAQIYGGRVVNVTLTGLTAPGGDGVLTVDAGADLGGTDKYLTLQADGLALGDLFVQDGQSGGRSSTQLALTQQQLATLAADGMATFSFTASAAVLPSGTNYIHVRLAYPGPIGGEVDYYKFDLGSGESAGLALSGAGLFTLGVYDPAGGLVASAQTGATAAIDSFLAQSAGTYYVKVEGSGQYTLLVNRDALAEAPANDGLPSAQALAGPVVAGRQWVMGGISAAGDADFYRLPLGSNGVLNVQAYAPAAAGEVNGLSPMLRLYDSIGHLVAVGESGRLQYHVPKGQAGDYYIEIAGADDTLGQYVLSVKGPPAGRS